MVKTLALIGLLAATLPPHAAAQGRDSKYVAGIRSGLLVGTMNLSGIDPAFADLEADGPKGAHISGYFLMTRVRQHLWVGIETLVSNSDKTAPTTMNYQAAGPVIELTYGERWFISVGMHAGGLIVNAMARQGAATSEGATSGSFYKGEGLFVAPQVDIGFRFGRSEMGLFVKQVNVFGEADRGGMSEFGSRFIGVRLAVGLKD